MPKSGVGSITLYPTKYTLLCGSSKCCSYAVSSDDTTVVAGSRKFAPNNYDQFPFTLSAGSASVMVAVVILKIRRFTNIFRHCDWAVTTNDKGLLTYHNVGNAEE
uniref:Uncharacterized protein n=1 Tax=Glossina pallidipes TaxID=7398 RepID=A0A1A9ZAI2_GLOPL